MTKLYSVKLKAKNIKTGDQIPPITKGAIATVVDVQKYGRKIMLTWEEKEENKPPVVWSCYVDNQVNVTVERMA